MDSELRRLFHELADLAPPERERFLAAQAIAPEMRAELESLLDFDSAGDYSLTNSVAGSAKDALGAMESESQYCGPYRLVRLLGSGGMGSVYLAERSDGEIQQMVAIKLLRAGEQRAAWRERFLNERQLLASLHHPSIVQVLDAGHTEDGRPYLVMEYVEGKTIDEYAEELEFRGRLALFLRVCDGVAYAHSRLIIHRDLKPTNILVDSAGQPKVLDFGIAKLVDESGDPTRTVERLLTPNYASPEQLLGQVQSTATDVYSLGAVLYKLLTGRSPHETQARGSPAMDVLAGTREIVPAARVNPAIPADVDYILRKALRKEPEERYPSVEAFATDIRSFLDSRPVQARAGDAWYRTRRFLRRNWVPLAAAALVIASLSAGLYVANRERLIAQRRFQQVRQLANQFIQMDAQIRDLPGSTNARQRIVSESLAYLTALGAEARGDRDLALEIANAYLQVARVQGVPVTANLGQFAQAEESLRHADSFASSVLAADPDNRRALLTSAEISHDWMIVVDMQDRRQDALAHARQVGDRLERLLRQKNLTPQEIDAATHLFANIGVAYENSNDNEDAIRYTRRAVDISQSVEAARMHRASAFGIMADALRGTGDLDAALAAIRQSIELLEQLPGNGVDRTFDLFNAWLREGWLLDDGETINLNQPEAALAAYRKALDIAEKLAGDDPNDYHSRHCIAAAGKMIGDIVRRQDPRRALAIYDSALISIRQARRNGRMLRDQADLLSSSSLAELALHRNSQAKAKIDEAFRLLGETKQYPAAQIEPLMEADHALRALASYYAHNGELSKAADTYQELLAKIAAWHASPDSSLRDAAAISEAWRSLSTVLRQAGNTSEAISFDRRRAELWQQWDHKLPGNPYIRRQLESVPRY